VARPASALLLLAVAVLPASARAYEDQLHLQLGAGWGVAPVFEPDLPHHGPNVALAAELGLSDAWGLALQATYGIHPAFDVPDELHALLAGLEVTYVFDIFEIVPRFGLGADFLLFGSAGAVNADVAVHALIALDWLPTREVVLGVDIRPYLLLTGLDQEPVYLSFLLRAGVLVDL
jgi:hypothetical protein